MLTAGGPDVLLQRILHRRASGPLSTYLEAPPGLDLFFPYIQSLKICESFSNSVALFVMICTFVMFLSGKTTVH